MQNVHNILRFLVGQIRPWLRRRQGSGPAARLNVTGATVSGLFVVVFVLVLGQSAQAMQVWNQTAGRKIFNAKGYEKDSVGKVPSTVYPGTWSASPKFDQVTRAAKPGPYEGSNYLQTTRDERGSGNPQAVFSAVQKKVGDHIHAEWMMYLPKTSVDAVVLLKGSRPRGYGRLTGGKFSYYDGKSYITTSMTWTAGVWQKHELDYVIGKATWTYTIAGRSITASALAGGGDLMAISFGHNGPGSYFLDEVSLQPAGTAAAAMPDSPARQDQETLPQMIQCTWSAAPPLPYGVQDNDGGIIDNHLIMVGGFCGGSDVEWKPKKYIRGFFKDAYALNLKNEKEGWFRLPNFPGIARQEMQAATVNNEIYIWGGFSYTAPYTFKDGYKLSYQMRGGYKRWRWDRLPDLPWGISTGGVCAIGPKIYIFGGADYDSQKFSWETDLSGKIKRFGARLLVFDTNNPDAGWRELAQCPGTTRIQAGTAAVDGKLYVIGGFAGSVDSWKYDPQTNQWERLRDMPVSCGGFGSGQIVYKNRYLLLATGYMSKIVRNLDGSTRPGYGKGSRVKVTWKQHPNLNGARFYNHLWVYDTKTNLYGTATSLPYEDQVPPTYIIGDTVYLFADETGGFEFDGEYFGHQPEFVLKGKLKELDWQQNK